MKISLESKYLIVKSFKDVKEIHTGVSCRAG